MVGGAEGWSVRGWSPCRHATLRAGTGGHHLRDVRHRFGAPATVTAMPRPISGNQLGKLGRRLAQPGPISDEDYEMLARVAEAYQAVLDKVEERLGQLGYEATTRVKTTGTLVDKLRRTPQLPLGSIHDVAGARIVIDGGRWEQDQVAERIMAAFADCPKPPEPIDRRERPSYGYRAFHVIVFEDSTPVEIQIRTKLQDTWAQISEKLGDMWGRGLRYGQGPDKPDAPAGLPGQEGTTRRDVVNSMTPLADAIASLEVRELQVAQIEPQVARMMNDLRNLQAGVVMAKSKTQTALDTVLKSWEAPTGGTQ